MNVSKEKELEEEVKDMERLQEKFRMFKAAKMVNCKRFKNSFQLHKNGKQITNAEEFYKIIKNHFKCGTISMWKVLNHYARFLRSRKTSIK